MLGPIEQPKLIYVKFGTLPKILYIPNNISSRLKSDREFSILSIIIYFFSLKTNTEQTLHVKL